MGVFLKLLGLQGGRRGRSCTSVDTEKGQGEQRGSVFSVCTGGAAVLGSFLQYRGGDAGLCPRRSTKESVMLEPLFEHTVVPTEEGWRGSP